MSASLNSDLNVILSILKLYLADISEKKTTLKRPNDILKTILKLLSMQISNHKINK